VSFASLIYLLAIVYVACKCGLRSALAGCGLLVLYAWLIYHYPISIVAHSHARPNSAVIGTAIFYPTFALIAGIVQSKLTKAAIRENEARAVADIESEQRKAAEAELWASEEMRRLIIDSTLDAVIGLTESGLITFLNPNAEQLFGWRQAEAIGSNFNDTIVLRGTRAFTVEDLKIYAKAASGANPRKQIELTAVTKMGEELTVELYAAEHKSGTEPVYIVFSRDISERKHSETAIRHLNASLEERVAERTAQLEAANCEMIGFTYSVSHDLRAPLRAIVSNSRIVCEEAGRSLDPIILGHLKRLEANALKMSQLIENLLNFARIGQVALDFQLVDLTAIANEIALELQNKGRGTISVERGLVVRGDPEMIKMIMYNLIENAWKYVQPGQTPDIEVGATAEGAIYVRDHGIGFDMKYADKVWEPFERLHRDCEFPGTGIGLANSKRIVTRHGGRMWTESEPGEGTTMYFELGDRVAPELVGSAAN
jgi:PAS domain S-box-containing protein